MTISKDTELSEILNSDDVTNIISTANRSIQTLINRRITVLGNEMTSGKGLSTDMVIENVPVYYNNALNIYTSYGMISDDFNVLEQTVIEEAKSKEISELEELLSCLEKDNGESEQEVSRLEGVYNNTLNGIPAENSSEKSNLYNQYYGPSGLIKVEKNRQEKNNEKIEKIEERLKKLDAVGTYNPNTSQNTDNLNSNPTEYKNEIPSNIGENGYYPDIIVDYDHKINYSGGKLLWIGPDMNINYPNGETGYHYVYNEQDNCYYEINENEGYNGDWVLQSDGQYKWQLALVPYNDIPKGESPQNYGYIPKDVSTIVDAEIEER